MRTHRSRVRCAGGRIIKIGHTVVSWPLQRHCAYEPLSPWAPMPRRGLDDQWRAVSGQGFLKPELREVIPTALTERQKHEVICCLLHLVSNCVSEVQDLTS